MSSSFLLLSLLVASSVGGGKGKELLILYTAIFFCVGLLGAREGSGSLARGGVESLVEKRIWLRILIVIRGMPPFPGFFLKFNILTFLVSTGQPGLFVASRSLEEGGRLLLQYRVIGPLS